MIFATVGTQLPFDRILGALDGWARQNPGTEIVAQTGKSCTDFPALSCQPFLAPTEFEAAMFQASIVVAHAGMGSILSASEMGKPIVIMPRRAAFGEHRNDHQIATAAEMSRLRNVHVAQDATALVESLDYLTGSDEVHNTSAISAQASEQLLSTVTQFIRTGTAI